MNKNRSEKRREIEKIWKRKKTENKLKSKGIMKDPKKKKRNRSNVTKNNEDRKRKY